MKLQLGLLFGEHMVLQQGKAIPVWGTSVNNDEITVTLNGVERKTETVNGRFEVCFDPMKAAEKTSLTVRSKKLDEEICFKDVAIGEVWLAGGQSNMEFLLKYDIEREEAIETEDDGLLRCFTCPQTPFLGFAEKEILPEHGFWRCWKSEEERIMFSAVGAYMGKILREKLDVPVGIISCNWGGTPAAAWTALEDLEANEKLRPIFEEYEESLKQIDLRKYYESAMKPLPLPTKEMQEFNDRFMMGEDMSEFFKNMGSMPKPDPSVWNAFTISPLSAVKHSALYENMLKKVVPYAIRGFLWYQGEDDDARERIDYYDESMIALIRSWRKLWNEELPFYQVELAPFRGIGITAAKRYHIMREKQYAASKALPDVYEICILDAGEEYNIHPRHKRIVGERLGRIVMKHSYGDDSVTADCPRFLEARREDHRIVLRFDNCADGLKTEGDLKESLFLDEGDRAIGYEYETEKDELILKGSFSEKIHISYCYSNYCVAVLYNSEGQPAFGFTCEV
jgi:sialate O-acetylesterase